MKNYQKIISAVLFSFLALCACGKKNESPYPVVDFHSDLQAKYLKDTYNSVQYYATGVEELSKPKGYQINFDNPDHNMYAVYLESDIDNRSYACDSETFIFNNLYLDTLYHYEIRKDGHVYYQGDFQTTDTAPRNIDVEGVTNFRDLGGHKTSNGKLSKQGMIYRSAKFNSNGSDEALITDKGRDVVIDELKIKAEIDLREDYNNENGHLTESVIDELVKYYAVPMRYDGTIIAINDQAIIDLFDIISEPSNYPFIFHCSIGTDRTGMVGFILNALLEVRVEEIYRDYLFSNFGNIGGSRDTSAIDRYIAIVSTYKGDTLKEQMISYLNHIGVDTSKINSFLEIMKA